MSKILGGVMLGGPKARGVRRHGDIVVGYQYVNDEPALVMWPARPGSQKCGAFVVCLSSAFKYVDDDYLVKQVFKACEVMGLFATKQQVYRIATAIQDNLDELVRMKPEQKEKPVSVGEGKLILPNGKTINFEMTRDQMEDMAS
jgi:hypothetical protein